MKKYSMMGLRRLFQTAQQQGIDVQGLLEQDERPRVDAGQLKRVKLEPEMLKEKDRDGFPVRLSTILEREDPSENYGSEMPLDSFERQLAARGLVIKGPKAVKLERFYDADNSVLFPEFIDRQVRIGQLMGMNELKDADIAIDGEEIDSGRYDAAYADMDKDYHLKRVAEGASMPKIRIATATRSVDLRKHGGIIEATYEQMRRISVNYLSVVLRLIGHFMSKDMAEDAVLVAMNGNTGNNNSAPIDTITGLNYDNMIDFWAEFSPYESNVMVVPKAGLTGILKMQEFKDPLIGREFQLSGNLVTPLGNSLKRHDPLTASLLDQKVLGVDNRFAVERIRERNAYLVETDKLITSQWNQIAISDVLGYAKLFAEAARVWDYS